MTEQGDAYETGGREGLPEPIKLPDDRTDAEVIEELRRELELRNEWIRQNHAETRRVRDLAQVLMDLDRCEHGRHEGDPCFGCPGEISAGNPHARNRGRVIGYGLDGVPIVLPDRERKHAPEAWRARP